MNRAAFFAAIKPGLTAKLSQAQVVGFEAILNAGQGLPITHLAYALATAWHETGTMMQPIKETVAASHKDKNPSDATVVKRLDTAWAKGQLKWVRTPYWRFDDSGKAWFGRGYVQLTHRDNYAKVAAMVSADLLGNPSLALSPDIAAVALIEGSRVGIYTGKKFIDYLPGDYVAARRIINGNDKAAKIAGYARKFEAALDAANYRSGGKPTPATPKIPPPIPAAPVSGFWAWLIALLTPKGN